MLLLNEELGEMLIKRKQLNTYMYKLGVIFMEETRERRIIYNRNL